MDERYSRAARRHVVGALRILQTGCGVRLVACRPACCCSCCAARDRTLSPFRLLSSPRTRSSRRRGRSNCRVICNARQSTRAPSRSATGHASRNSWSRSPVTQALDGHAAACSHCGDLHARLASYARRGVYDPQRIRCSCGSWISTARWRSRRGPANALPARISEVSHGRHAAHARSMRESQIGSVGSGVRGGAPSALSLSIERLGSRARRVLIDALLGLARCCLDELSAEGIETTPESPDRYRGPVARSESHEHRQSGVSISRQQMLRVRRRAGIAARGAAAQSPRVRDPERRAACAAAGR